MKSAYQRNGFMADLETVSVWYELLKVSRMVNWQRLCRNTLSARHSLRPLRISGAMLTSPPANDWSVAWNKLQGGAKPKEVDYAGQYAFVTIGRQAFESGDLRAMTEFQRLYREFNLMDKTVKQELFRSGMLVWREEDKAARLEQKNHDCKRLSGSAE